MTDGLVVGGCKLGYAGPNNTDLGHTHGGHSRGEQEGRLQNTGMAVEPWSKYHNVEPNSYAVVKSLLLTVMQ
jgi:hypothetical protein